MNSSRSIYLDKFIRKNPCLWGDFCEMDPFQPNKLSLDRKGYEEDEPVPAISKTAKPRPELHFKFSTRIMLIAIDLYKREIADFQYKSEFARLALKSLESFVERTRRSTQESLELMVEEVYTRYMKHEAFLSSAKARNKVKDLQGTVIQEKSKKLEGYAWYLRKGQSVRVPPENQGEVVFIDDEDDVEEEAEIPQLEVKFKDAPGDNPFEEFRGPNNLFEVDFEGSEQSEGSSTPGGRYSGQTSDEEEIAEAGESMREYDPGAHQVTREGLIVGQFVRLAKKRATVGEDIVLVDQLPETYRVMIKRMIQKESVQINQFLLLHSMKMFLQKHVTCWLSMLLQC